MSVTPSKISALVTALTNKFGNKVTSWQSTPSDSNVPSEKLVKEYIDDQIGTAIQYITQ